MNCRGATIDNQSILKKEREEKMRKPLMLVCMYSVLVLILATIFHVTKNPILVALSQVLPLIITFMMLGFLHKNRLKALEEMGLFKIGSIRWYIYGLLAGIPIIISFLGAWLLGYVNLLPTSEYPEWIHSRSELIMMLVKHHFTLNMILTPFIFAFAEEIGWRGMLHSQLLKVSNLKKTIVYTGLIWILFHYPFYINGYNSNGEIWINMLMFTLTLIPLSVVMSWVRIKSQSLWPVVLFHMSINFHRGLWEQLFFTKSPNWELVAGETGVISFIIWSVLAFPAWRSLSGETIEPYRKYNSIQKLAN